MSRRLLLMSAALLALVGASAAQRCDQRGTAAGDRLTGGWLDDHLCGLGGADLLRA